jgi:hypothetical protein
MEIIERMEHYRDYVKKFPNARQPPYQRKVIEYHVDTMKSDIKDYIDVNGVQPALGLILLCRYVVNGKYRYDIVDGQHRIKAIKQLYEEGGGGVPITFNIGIINVRSEAEAEQQYLMLNRSMNHSEVLEELHKDDKVQLMKECEEWLHSSYGNVFVYRPTKRPYINIGDFIKVYVKSNYFPGTNTLAEFKRVFNEYNNYLGEFDVGNLTLGKSKISANTIETIKSNGIYYAFLCGEDYFAL